MKIKLLLAVPLSLVFSVALVACSKVDTNTKSEASGSRGAANFTQTAPETKKAEDTQPKREVVTEKFPYYAVLFCGINGNNINIQACFSGDVGTEIELRNGEAYGLYKSYQIPNIGKETRDGLLIDLENNFELTAQNSSENLILGIKVFQKSTNEIVFQKQVSQFGAIKISN